jgi:hypothetical protein
VDAERARRLWSAWKVKPRASLVDLGRLEFMLFALIPLLAVVFGAETVVGIGDDAPLIGRLGGALAVLLGLPFLYLDWVYVRRPVRRTE